MDLWKPFRLATLHHAPQASILFDKFHVLQHLGDALENKVALGFVEGLNNKIRALQRHAYGLRDEECLRFKILTCMLAAI